MTKNQQAISWGLTSFFGVICLAAAPQLSIGLFVKCGIVSTALGFGIAAISNAVGELFSDASFRSNSVNCNHTDIHVNPTLRRRWFGGLFSNDHAYDYSRSPRNRQTQNGTYLGSHIESVTPPIPMPGQNTANGTFLNRTVEPVYAAPTQFPNTPKPTGQYLGSRTESVAQPLYPSTPSTYSPSYSSASSKPAQQYVGSRVEPVNPSGPSNSGGWFSGGGASDSKPAATHIGRRVEML